jgi:pyruvate formate lyase activating enzyme
MTVKPYLIKKYFEVINSNDKYTVKCLLCPRKCAIAKGKAGVCQSRANIDGKLYSLVYGYPCSIHVDPVEKKPLYHFYPGEKILSFGTYGCNLFCKGCQNFDIARMENIESAVKEIEYYSPEDIVNIALKRGIRMIAYTYNEPTIFFEYMIDIAKIARKKGIKNVIVSNGYINPQPLKELCKYIDAANIDIKGADEKFYAEYCKADMKPILANIKTMRKFGVWVEVTNLLISGLNDDPEYIKKLCEWVKDNVGADTPLHFSRFYPYYKALEIKPTPEKTLLTAKDIAFKTGLKYVYIGNCGILEDTLCTNSKCNTLLIERSLGIVEVKEIKRSDNMNKSTCSKCGKLISGMF